MLPCPVVNISEKPQQSNPGRIIDNLDMFGVNMWFTSPDTELRTIEELAEGEGNIVNMAINTSYTDEY